MHQRLLQNIFSFKSVIILITLLGLLVRLFYLMNLQIALDESYTYSLSTLRFKDLIFQNGQYWDYSHPSGFYLFAKLWSALGTSETWLRIPSLLSYIGSIFFLIKTMKIFRSKLATFLTVTIFCFQPIFIEMSTQFRMYGLILFIFTACIYLVTRLLSDRCPSKIQATLFSLLLAVGFYIDYASVWLIGTVIVLTCVLILLRHSKANMFLKMILLIGIFVLPQAMVVVTHTAQINDLNRHLTTIFTDNGFRIYLGFVGMFGFVNLGFVTLGVAILSSIYQTLISFYKKHENWPTYCFLSLGILVPLTTATVYSFIFHPLFQIRNLVVVNMFVVTGLGIFVSRIPVHKVTALLTCLCLIPILYVFFINNTTLYRINNTQSRDARLLLERGCGAYYIGGDSGFFSLGTYTLYYDMIPYPLHTEIHRVLTFTELQSVLNQTTRTCSVLFVGYDIDEQTRQLLQDTDGYCQENMCSLIDI